MNFSILHNKVLKVLRAPVLGDAKWLTLGAYLFVYFFSHFMEVHTFEKFPVVFSLDNITQFFFKKFLDLVELSYNTFC